MLRILAKAAAVFVGGTFVISAIGAQVVRQNVTKNSVNRKRPCNICQQKGFYPCKLCKGDGTIRWSPLYDPVYINPCLCPTCDGNKVQKCLNCLGLGSA